MRRKVISAMMVLFGIGLAFGGEVPVKPFKVDEHTLFLCHFDREGFVADYARGKREPLDVKNVDLDEGKFGNCISISKEREDVGKAVCLRYSLKDNINLERGTLEFWICPQTDLTNLPLPTYFLIFSIDCYNPQTKGYGFGYSRFTQWGSFQVSLYDHSIEINRRRVDFFSPIKKWKAYEWHYIKIIWSKEGCGLYIDGKRAEGDLYYYAEDKKNDIKEKRTKLFIPYPVGIEGDVENLTLIIGPNKEEHSFGYCIDELRISDIVRKEKKRK